MCTFLSVSILMGVLVIAEGLVNMRPFRARHSGITFGRNTGGSGGIGPPSGLVLFSSSMEDGSNNSNSSDNNEDTNKELEEVFDRLDDNKNPISRQWSKLPDETRSDILTTGGSFLFAVIVRLLIIEPRFIPSLSMFPTFNIGDQLLVNKVGKFSRGSQGYLKRDVVVFNPPEAYTEMTGNDEALIKRIVATEGDSVEVKGHRLYINGALQEEPFTNELPDYDLKPISVPKGMFLVLGDNRNHSFDSHVWGFLPQENVIGRAVCR